MIVNLHKSLIKLAKNCFFCRIIHMFFFYNKPHRKNCEKWSTAKKNDHNLVKQPSSVFSKSYMVGKES